MIDGGVDARTERERKLFGLQASTERLLGAESREETARIAVEAARDVLGVPLAGFHVHDGDGRLRPLAWLDTVDDELGDPPTYRRDGDGLADRLVWATFESGEPFVVDDVAAFDPALAARTPTRSGIIHPFEAGVFIVSATEPDAFDEGDIALVWTLANALCAALERVEDEQLLRDRERELERQNERLGEFTSMVSHDLRNPLTVANGRIELALEATDDPTVREHLVAADGALDRMGRLVEHLLELARQGRAIGATATVAVADAARDAWAQFDPGDTRLVLDLDDDVVDADPERLGQVFANLFANAVEHGTTGAGQVTVGPLEDGAGFYVADDGPGIPASKREAVFESGYSTVGGTGFGLAIARGAVEAHGWELRATESVDGGARFEVRTGD